MDTTATDERETVSQDTTPTPKIPSVPVFKETVAKHCRTWEVTSVEGLCTVQTQALIEELAQYFR